MTGHREPWFASSVLDAEQQARALAWADRKISAGHHSACQSWFGHKCDCYFGRGEYLAAQLLREAADNRLHEALDMLRAAWNAHMDECDKHKALPDLPAPSAEDIQRWLNAPSNTASADSANTSSHPRGDA